MRKETQTALVFFHWRGGLTSRGGTSGFALLTDFLSFASRLKLALGVRYARILKNCHAQSVLLCKSETAIQKQAYNQARTGDHALIF